MKYLSIIRYIFLALSVVIVAIPFMTAGGQPVTNVDTMLNWAGFLMCFAILVAICLPIVNAAKNPKGILRSSIGIIIVAVVIGVCYSMSDATPVVTPSQTYDNVIALRLSDTGLFTTYFAMGVAVFSIIVMEIYNLIK